MILKVDNLTANFDDYRINFEQGRMSERFIRLALEAVAI